MMIDIIFDVALDDLLGLFPRIVILKYFSMFFFTKTNAMLILVLFDCLKFDNKFTMRP